MTKKIGILLTNTGTPDAPTASAVRRYLREFLSDKRIVQLPRLVWLPILYGLILITRPYKSAQLYKKIWLPNGSPMRIIMQKLHDKLQAKLALPVEVGMNYGNPSIQAGLEKLQKNAVEKIIVLPLYPQYSDTTTASSLDRVTAVTKNWKSKPEVIAIQGYAAYHDYIRALAASASDMPAAHLVISFHGIPEYFAKAGDPYQSQCELTAKLLTEELKLERNKWTLCYQSQFGYAKWLQPSLVEVLTELPTRGIKQVNVICPGFAVDCLETLEEIAIRSKAIFLNAGGETLHYIPALNDSDFHVDMLATLISEHQ